MSVMSYDIAYKVLLCQRVMGLRVKWWQCGHGIMVRGLWGAWGHRVMMSLNIVCEVLLCQCVMGSECEVMSVWLYF